MPPVTPRAYASIVHLSSYDPAHPTGAATGGADVVVRSRRVVLPDGERPAAVHSRDGRITAVTGFDDVPADAVTLADDEVLLPGLVDSHVHVNEPGRTEWEGFATATRAAAAGGVTTIVDMPLNSDPARRSRSRRCT